MSPGATHFRALPFGVLWGCYFAAIGLFSPYSPLWLSHLGYSTLAVGAFASLQSWTRVVSPYAWGWLADHGGRRVVLLRVAAVVSMVAAGGLWLVRDAGVWPLALVVAALFLANGAVTPIAETMLLKHLHGAGGLDARRYGRVRLWGSIGFVVSVLVFGFVLQRTGIDALPLFTLGLFGLLALATWVLPHSAEPAAPARTRASVWPVLRRPVVLWFFAGMMLTVLAHTSLYAFFSLYLSQLGYGKPAVGVLWAVSVGAEIVFFAMAGRFFARIDEYRWLQLAALATALRFAATAAFGDTALVLVLAQLTHALTFAAQHMACTSLIARHFPDHLRARGQGLYSTLGYGVPGVVGGLAGGLLSEAFGLASVFWAAALVALVSAGCCVMAGRAQPGTMRPAAPLGRPARRTGVPLRPPPGPGGRVERRADNRAHEDPDPRRRARRRERRRKPGLGAERHHRHRHRAGPPGRAAGPARPARRGRQRHPAVGAERGRRRRRRHADRLRAARRDQPGGLQDRARPVQCPDAHRARAQPGVRDASPLLGKDGFAVDEVICPEESVTTYIGKLIEYPEALQVLEFSQRPRQPDRGARGRRRRRWCST